ncbi:DUF2142 domain-containing protein [Cryptosporangium aurantiacum]|uniref:Predicted membrane protein n=1 Tax=Cryptosporangium aurantiacum TaxID=134849 RepID=A0A1M7QUJ0_9ACTN|nr:DUF2142 domain-containing protein [Cryptosporangium aurantiacum]SHN35379.1 Predicted membrane protein [Cryptosporangium aurantiacum]
MAGPGVAVAAASEAAGPGSIRGRWVLLVAVVSFFLMGAGWAAALPVNGTYDESQHLVRAYAVASGQVYATPTDAIRGGGAWFDVPRSLLPDDIDCTFKDRAPASCQTPAPDDESTERVASAAGRYNPVYYAVVGLPLLVSPDLSGIVAARLVSALGAAVMLGLAVFVAVRRRRPLLVAGLIVVATPMAMNLNGAINPNGWEIAAGVLLWTTLLTLFRARPGELSERFTRLLVILAGVSGSLLLVLRALGPVLLILIVFACLLLGRRASIMGLVRRLDVWWVLGVGAVVGIYAIGWMLLSGLSDSEGAEGNAASTIPYSDALRQLALVRSSFWVNQLVGQFSYGETVLPSWTIIAWYLTVGALVGPALAVVKRRHALVLLAILATSFVALAALELAYLRNIGWSQHGRYIVPFGVGLVLGAVSLRRVERTFGATGVGRIVPGIAVITGLLHLWVLLLVQTRFQFGQGSGLNPLRGSWKPPLGSFVPLFAELLGVVLLVLLAFWVVRRLPVPPADDARLSAGGALEVVPGAAVGPEPVDGTGTRADGRAKNGRQPTAVTVGAGEVGPTPTENAAEAVAAPVPPAQASRPSGAADAERSDEAVAQ